MHSPSEHQVDGATYELEVNMEFSNFSFRVFFDSAKGGAGESEFIGSVFDAFRTKDFEFEDERLAVDFELLRAALDFSSFYSY